jgi:putative DNA primase/helicase
MSSRLDLLTKYSKRGWRLVPCNPGQKTPLISDTLILASCDLGQILKWEDEFSEPNWGLYLAGSGLVAIDVDTRKGGMEHWLDLVSKNGEPETLKAQTGSGGFHYIFRAETNVQYHAKFRDGIDVKYNGYILVEPSIHPNGQPYLWLNGDLW